MAMATRDIDILMQHKNSLSPAKRQALEDVLAVWKGDNGKFM